MNRRNFFQSVAARIAGLLAVKSKGAEPPEIEDKNISHQEHCEQYYATHQKMRGLWPPTGTMLLAGDNPPLTAYVYDGDHWTKIATYE